MSHKSSLQTISSALSRPVQFSALVRVGVVERLLPRRSAVVHGHDELLRDAPVQSGVGPRHIRLGHRLGFRVPLPLPLPPLSAFTVPLPRIPAVRSAPVAAEALVRRQRRQLKQRPGQRREVGNPSGSQGRPAAGGRRKRTAELATETSRTMKNSTSTSAPAELVIYSFSIHHINIFSRGCP